MTELTRTPRRIWRNLSVILRTERLIARRRMAVLRGQSTLLALGGLIGIIGLVMLDVAALSALREVISPPLAALTVALVNLVLAAIIVAAALRMNAEAELEPVLAVQELAYSEIESDLEAAVTELREAGADIHRMVRNPLGNLLPELLAPLLAMLLSGSGKDKRSD